MPCSLHMRKLILQFCVEIAFLLFKHTIFTNGMLTRDVSSPDWMNLYLIKDMTQQFQHVLLLLNTV